MMRKRSGNENEFSQIASFFYIQWTKIAKMVIQNTIEAVNKSILLKTLPEHIKQMS